MKQGGILFPLWVIVFLFCFTLHAEEKLLFSLDDRLWKIGFESNSKMESLIELVLQNEEITSWSELFTIQRFEGVPISASDFISLLKTSSEKNIPSHQKLRFQLFQPAASNLFETSFINKHSDERNSFDFSNNEYNLARVLKGKNTLYYLRYSTKDSQLFEKNKFSWLEKLKSATLTLSSQPEQEQGWFSLSSKGIFYQKKPLNMQENIQFIEDRDVGFGISIPKEWHVIRQQNSSEARSASELIYTEILQLSQPEKHLEGKISFLTLSKEQIPFKARVHYLSWYKANHPQAKLIHKGKIQTILGQEGLYLILLDGEKKGWITFMQNGNRCYALELWAKQENFTEMEKEFEAAILNFQTCPNIAKLK